MPRDLVLVALSLVTWGIGEGMFFYFQPIYLEELGADPLAIGAILGGYGIAMTVAHIPAGILADRYGRKPLMFAAWFLGTVAAWVMALAESLPIFVIGLLLYGVTIFVVAPLNSYVTAASGKWPVSRTITLISASFNLGAVVGPWLGGRIGDQEGLRVTYLIAAWLFVLSTVIFLFIRSQQVESAPAGSRSIRVLQNRRFVLFLLVVFLAMYAMYLPQPLSPNYLQNERGLSLERIGWLYSITGAGIVLLQLLLGQLEARSGFLISQIGVAAFALSLWRGTDFHWYAVGYFLLGGYRTARSLAIALAQPLIPGGNMGLAYGLVETVGSAATILAPPLAGFLYQRAPIQMYSFSLGLAALAVLVSSRFMARRPEKLTEVS